MRLFFENIRSSGRGAVIVLLSCSLLALTACNKQLDIKSTSLSNETGAWDSYDDVGSALTGLYGLLRTAMADQNAYWLFGDLRSGDFTAVSRPDLKAIIDGKLNLSYPLIQQLLDWRRYYAVIDACNQFIEHSGQALADKRYTELNNKIDIAQARAIRAYTYFYIARIWGDVPLITSTHDGQLQAVPRASQQKVLSFASTELQAAAKVLPFVYGKSDDPIFPGNYYGYDYTKYYNTLFNRVYAYCVLAHIAAWQGKYNEAAAYCDFVMNNYDKIGAELIDDITELTDGTKFFNDRVDVRQIFSMYMATGYNESGISGMGHIESLTLATPLISKQRPGIYVSKDSINNIFSDLNDVRFGRDTISGVYSENYFINYEGDMPIFSKIKVIGDGTSGNLAVFSSSIVPERLEEIYLLQAEAYAVMNQTTDAITALNKVKGIRAVALYDGAGGAPLIKAIFAERRRELMGEGWRWYDLVRENRLLQDDAAFNQLIKNRGIYWPVAQKNVTGGVNQNPYWL